MAQVPNICENCQPFSSDIAVSNGNPARCQLCNGRLENQTVLNTPAHRGSETKAAKAMLGEINASGRRKVFSNLFFFGVLAGSFLFSMWLWFWMCENTFADRYGTMWAIGTNVTEFFSIGFMVVTYFVMKAGYRICGVPTPIDEYRERKASRPHKASGNVGKEASKFASKNKKGVLVVIGIMIVITAVDLSFGWSVLSQSWETIAVALMPLLVLSVAVYFGARGANKEVMKWSEMSGQSSEIDIDLEELRRRPFEIESLRPLVEKICVLRTEAPPMTSNREDGYFCSFAVGTDGQLYDIEGSTDRDAVVVNASWLATALQVACEDRS